MKRTNIKGTPTPYEDPYYKMPWGCYAGHRIKRIPAQYFLDLEKHGWALPDMLWWISQNRKELTARATEQNENGYTTNYHIKHAWK